MLAIFGLIGCGGNGAARDVERYQAVLAGDAGLRVCLQIEDVSLAGECSLIAAQRQSAGRAGQLALHCPDVQGGLWQDECWFLAAEEASGRGRTRQAVSLCRQAGRFAEDCSQHLWQGSLNEIVRKSGGFGAGLPAAETLATQWGALIAAPTFQQRYWFRYYADGFASRDRVDLFACESLPTRHVDACVDAGVAWYRTELGVRLSRVAGMGALCDVASPSSLSLAPWFPVAPDSRLDEVVSERKAVLCGAIPDLSEGAAPG